MANTFAPKLAFTLDPKKDPECFKHLRLPVYASRKLDGIRTLPMESTVFSRKLLPLPNKHLQTQFGMYSGLDGEVLLTDRENDYDVYNATQSAVMSREGEPDLTFWVFDIIDEKYRDYPFSERIQIAEDRVRRANNPKVRFLEQVLCHTLEELFAFEAKAIAEGAEGICTCAPEAPYKWGRSTLGKKDRKNPEAPYSGEQGLGKWKRFTDTEGVLVALEEKMTNLNKAEKNELGLTKRSHHQAGKVGADTTGTFIVMVEGVECRVATGTFKHAQLKDIWDSWPRDKNKLMKVRFFDHGCKNLPRHMRSLGFRDIMDM